MKKYIVLSMLLAVIALLLGQGKSAEDHRTKPISDDGSAKIAKARKAAESNYAETFADAFKDPNIFVGVFDLPELSPKHVPTTTLSSGEILEFLPGYAEAMVQFSLTKLRCVRPIKGKFDEAVIFVSRDFPPVVEAAPRIPMFTSAPGSKWVLALEKTSQKTRVDLFGEAVEKYRFVNDHTMFRVFRYGHGALCLKWPEKDKKFPEPAHLVKVPDSIVEELEAIHRVVPYTRKENIDPNESVIIKEISKGLKTDVAKSIFAKLLGDKLKEVQDPNDAG